ncbi:MAG: tyrosine-protein phosphatase [Clostridia bacterium]|nr:tyrosine-protein phosphatase [Clostridia bacterium]
MRCKTKRIISLLIAAALMLSALALGGCGGSNEEPGEAVTTGEIGVVRDEEFGNVYIDLTIDGFNALGFAFGDSVDIAFDNGKSYEDVPYYSGYYVPVGEMLACGYPGYPHVVIARNYGASTWEEFEMTESSKVTVTLRERGKYMAVQELYALDYSDLREEFDSDIMFANFREVVGGNLKKGGFYRSASPCDNQHNRAAYANRFAEEYGVRFVLNLSDNETKYKAHTEKEDFVSEYYDSLYKEGNVLLMALNANYRADGFAQVVSDAFVKMTENGGRVLIHCVEGKDRTGFVCALLLALAGASAQEIVDDYMITYYNYYGITKEGMPDKYEAVKGNVDDFLYCMCEAEKGTDINTLDLKKGGENYLRRGGLTDGQIAKIEAFIAG